MRKSLLLQLQRVDGRLKGLIEFTEVDAVEEAVVDFHRHPQRFAAGAVRHVLPPRDAGDVVVPVKISLVGQGRQVQPRDAGKIDEGVQLLVVLVEEVVCASLRALAAAQNCSIVCSCGRVTM